MNPKQLFDYLVDRINELLALARGLVSDGSDAEAESIFRACIVLSIAAVDTYMHEKGILKLHARVGGGGQALTAVRTYIKATSPGAPSLSEIRYRLSFRTLTTGDAIDELLNASGAVANSVWQNVGIALGQRQQRIRNALDIATDRRNQIAHEGDWDFVQLQLRHISEPDAQAALTCVRTVVDGLEAHW